jgi:hypothetical protein
MRGLILRAAAFAAAATLAVGAQALDREVVKSDLGVEILGVVPTAAGYMLDLRFRVLDPAKAAPLLDAGVGPRLIDDADHVLMVPADRKVGRLRNTPKHVAPGMVLAVLFANPGRLLVAGDEVDVAFGDVVLEDLVIGEFEAATLGLPDLSAPAQ